MSEQSLLPVVEVTRGKTVESRHHAVAVVVDRHGALVAWMGAPDHFTFSRSSLKPFQALPTVLRGFPDRFGLTDRHVALMCASHSGEDRHVQTAQEILDAIGAKESDLRCGVHIPYAATRTEDAVPGRAGFTQLHNNCSGKHSGMLALAKILGTPFADYLKLDSPVQQLIRAHVAEMLNLTVADMPVGIDGCSAPNYAVPLRALAHGFARLASSAGPTPATDEDCQDACVRIVKAMRAYPEMVSGEGRFDLELSRATKARIFSKAGGEAVQCVGIPERGWGMALKILDGSPRAIPPIVIGILAELGLLSTEESALLEARRRPVVLNHRGTHVGEIRLVGKLVRP